MGFLQQFLQYKKICIQCHNNPDADTLASAYGAYCFFTDRGVEAEMVYGGAQKVKKYNIKYMIKHCGIPIRYTDELPQDAELLLVIDGQYGQGNVQKFEAPVIAVIDHHPVVMEENERVWIKSNYQSCSTIMWELLEEEHYSVKQKEALRIALLYGLFTDTSSFYDLYREKDIQMRMELSGEFPMFEKLTKSCMTVGELMIASDAMYHHFFDIEKKFAIISALRCDQAVLGIIGDFVIQVDIVLACFTYTSVNGGYQISVRSCDDQISAGKLAAFVCEGIGSGGGHAKKAGGRISEKLLQEKYGKVDVFDFIFEKMNSFIPG